MSFRSYEQGLSAASAQIPEQAAIAGALVGTDAAHEPQTALDSLTTSGERVLFHWGLGLGEQWLVPDGTDPIDPAPSIRSYPDNATPRVLARADGLAIVAGCVLAMRVLAIPSGATQLDDGAAGYVSGGGGGGFELVVTYANSDGDSVTVSASAEVGASAELYSAEPESAHEALVELEVEALPSEAAAAAIEELYARGLDVVAAWELRATGAPRPVDVVVLETTHKIVVSSDAPAWPSALYTEAGQVYEQLPSDYPIERLADDDEGGGTIAIRRALLEHGRALGPALFTWSSGTEHARPLSEWISYGGGTGDDEAPPYEVFGTERKQVPYGIAPAAVFPALASGSYARGVTQGAQWLTGTGVIPVMTSWYVRGSKAKFELCSGDPTQAQWSCIAIEVDSDDVWQLIRVPGWLEVGVSPGDAPGLRIYAYQTAPPVGADFGAGIRYCGAYFRRV